MSDFVMERDMNYAKDLSVEDKKVFLQTLMQLAKTDGSVDGGEKKFIVELARLFGVSSQDAEEIKRKRDDDEVVEALILVKPTDTVDPGVAPAGIVTANVPRLPLLVIVPPGWPNCTPVALGLYNPKLPDGENELYAVPPPKL